MAGKASTTEVPDPGASSILLRSVPTCKTKTVVVTGASGGVGRAVARAFAESGATVAVLARGEAGLDGAVRDVEAAAARVDRELGAIDVCVNVAFTSVFAPFAEVEPAEFKRVTEVSYLGNVYGTKPRWPGCSRGTTAQSCRSARLSPTAAFRCSRRTAVRSTRSRGSTSRCTASCCTTSPTCT